MKKLTRLLALAALALPLIAQAHPGHEGHELTWDFDHLVGHPLATVLCFTVIGTIGWGVRQFLRSRRDQAGIRVRRR